MGIEQNFNNNLDKAVKKQTPNMPRDSKFLLHQLVKNIDEVEDMLDSDNVVAEYNVGELREVIEDFENEEELDEWVPGSWTNYSGYGKVKPAFNYKSQGPIPGAMIGSGYNFESGGPLGVSYFTESKKYNVGDLKQVIHSLKEDKKELNEALPCTQAQLDADSCGDCGDGYTWDDRIAGCLCVGPGGGVCHEGTGSMAVGYDDGTTHTKGKSGLKNRGRGEKATDSLRHESVGDMISEKDSKYCGRKLGKCCDGGDKRKCGKWEDDEANKKCTCSYKGACCSGSSGKSVSKDVEKEMDEATTTASSGAYSTPRFWAKDKKNQRFAKERWMPGAQYVKVKEKCKKFPYCNQGDINALEIWEKEIMRESAKKVSKKTGLSEKEVREKIEREIQELITRGFYKSPVTDLVGGGKMDTPIGKIFTMSGNKPKYES